MKKVVVLTGASSGLGKEIARLLSQKENYHLILTGRNEKGFEEFKNDQNVSLVIGDITQSETLDEIEKTVKKQGRVDILINNAGITSIKPFEANTEEELDLLFATDLKAPMLLTQRIYPVMLAQQSGQIINVNSTAGLEPKLHHTMYCAIKWGLTGFTKTLRLEAKKHNIRVTSFHPGGMNTAFYDKIEGVPVETYMNPKSVAEMLINAIETDATLSPDEIVINRMTK